MTILKKPLNFSRQFEVEKLPKIDGLEVTHVFKRTNKDCIIIENKSDIVTVKFVDGSKDKMHKSHLLPIIKRKFL